MLWSISADSHRHTHMDQIVWVKFSIIYYLIQFHNGLYVTLFTAIPAIMLPHRGLLFPFIHMQAENCVCKGKHAYIYIQSVHLPCGLLPGFTQQREPIHHTDENMTRRHSHKSVASNPMLLYVLHVHGCIHTYIHTHGEKHPHR